MGDYLLLPAARESAAVGVHTLCLVALTVLLDVLVYLGTRYITRSSSRALLIALLP